MKTEKRRSFIINFTYFLLIAAIVACVLKYFLPMVAPFVIGLIIAWIMRKPTRYISLKWKINYKITALVMVLFFYVTIGLLCTLITVKAISGIQELVVAIPDFYENDMIPIMVKAYHSVENALIQIEPSMLEFLSNLGEQMLQSLGKMISSLSAWMVSTVSGLAASIPGLFIKIVLMIISSCFIAADYDMLSDFCLRQLSPKAGAMFGQIRSYVIGTLFVCIRSYIIIMSLTFVELSVGLTLIGINYSVLIAALIAIFDILPVLGTGGIMLPWVVITLLSGDFSRALALLLVYIAITVIRNIVEPKIVGGQLGLHPIVTLVSMTVGLQLFGVIGLFGFPIVLSLLRHLNDNGTIHILK